LGLVIASSGAISGATSDHLWPTTSHLLSPRTVRVDVDEGMLHAISALNREHWWQRIDARHPQRCAGIDIHVDDPATCCRSDLIDKILEEGFSTAWKSVSAATRATATKGLKFTLALRSGGSAVSLKQRIDSILVSRIWSPAMCSEMTSRAEGIAHHPEHLVESTVMMMVVMMGMTTTQDSSDRWLRVPCPPSVLLFVLFVFKLRLIDDLLAIFFTLVIFVIVVWRHLILEEFLVAATHVKTDKTIWIIVVGGIINSENVCHVLKWAAVR
jgi:hypothetical protein